MKKKKAIMLADTRPALIGHMLLQIRDTNRNNFDEVIILDTQIPEQDKKLMQDIMPCRFLPYQSPISETLLEMERFQRFSLIMFGRYEMFRLLNEYSLIMWIDTDMLIQGDLGQLLKDTEGYGLSILREDPKNKSSKNVDYMRTNFIRAVEQYDMNSYLCCTGLIIVRDVLQQVCDYTQWCYDKTLEWADNLNLPDQGVINALIQDFNIDIYPIGENGTYGCFPYIGRDCSKAILIHSWGSNKFWNDYYLNQTFPVWEKTYQEWLNLGGSVLERKQVPEVSVVIPVYKPDLGYFKQCIDSLIDQRKNDYEFYSNFEIIIIAEPFNQQEIQKFIASYKDVRLNLYFNETRLGIAASLNRGIRLATGKYIARLDDDDIAVQYRLQKQVEYLENNPEITLCTSDYLYFGDMNDGRVSMEGEMAKAWSVLTCPFDHPTIMFRKDFFVKNDLFYDETRGYVEDWELWKRAFKKGMQVGCIHDILLYHRWHSGSAGQNNKTVVMMREMIKNNFQELGVEVPDEDLPLLSPWNGKVTSDADYQRLEQYFRDALERNNILKLYDSFSLAHVFSLRLTEARTGQLEAITINRMEDRQTEQHHDMVKATSVKKTVKRLLKKMIKPFYQPFRHRYEDRLIEMTNLSYSLNERLNKALVMIESQEKIINDIVARLDDASKNIDLISVNQEQYANTLNIALLQNQEKLGNKLDAKVFEECENTRQMLSAKVFEECENTRQMLSANMYQESENTRQMLSAKVFEESEHIRHEILDQVNRHIDFTYRDIMVAMERQKPFLPENNIKLITDHPVAYKSLDHLHPHGTIRDNTRYPRFVEQCEEILDKRTGLSFVDVRCSGGGMVLEAALRGHTAMGLEGSDSSKKEQRAEWRLLGDRLQTCDVTKPFHIECLDGSKKKFDIITAWEVMEHIQESDLPQMLHNIKNHLSDTGYFVASIANWEDIDSESGINWHVTLHGYEWWIKLFEDAGFEIHSDLFEPIDMARGTYNPPHCYEALYPEYDSERNFYVAVSVVK